MRGHAWCKWASWLKTRGRGHVHGVEWLVGCCHASWLGDWPREGTCVALCKLGGRRGSQLIVQVGLSNRGAISERGWLTACEVARLLGARCVSWGGLEVEAGFLTVRQSRRVGRPKGSPIVHGAMQLGERNGHKASHGSWLKACVHGARRGSLKKGSCCLGH